MRPSLILHIALVLVSVQLTSRPCEAFPLLSRFQPRYISTKKGVPIFVKATDANISPENYSAASLKSLTFHHVQIYSDEDELALSSDLLSDFLMELGAISVSSSQITSADRHDVVAHFGATADINNVIQTIQTSLDVVTMPEYTVESIEDMDWITKVQKEHWQPMFCSGFVLEFPWHTDDDVRAVLSKANVALESIPNIERLKLQGGVAFGSGDHPTTRLCLSWVRNLMSDESNNIKYFLDYGSGSGVLGLAACALAVNKSCFEAIGVEIDVDAIRIANENAKLNQLNMRSFLPKLDSDHLDSETLSKVLTAGGTYTEVLPDVIDQPKRLYDACVANILALPLADLAPVIASMMKNGSPLALSGILSGAQAETILNVYNNYFYNMRVEAEEEGWVLITGLRNPRAS